MSIERLYEFIVNETDDNKDLIKAVALLKSADVKANSEERVEFLKKEGISDNEILQALDIATGGLASQLVGSVAESMNEKIDWKKILASAAIVAALAVSPIKAMAADKATLDDLWGFLGSIVSTTRTMQGGGTPTMGDVEDMFTGRSTVWGQVATVGVKGYATWGGTSNAMTSLRSSSADIGKYYKVITEQNEEVVVKCIGTATMQRNEVIRLSRGAFAQIADLDDAYVYVTVQELD